MRTKKIKGHKKNRGINSPVIASGLYSLNYYDPVSMAYSTIIGIHTHQYFASISNVIISTIATPTRYSL